MSATPEGTSPTNKNTAKKGIGRSIATVALATGLATSALAAAEAQPAAATSTVSHEHGQTNLSNQTRVFAQSFANKAIKMATQNHANFSEVVTHLKGDQPESIATFRLGGNIITFDIKGLTKVGGEYDSKNVSYVGLDVSDAKTDAEKYSFNVYKSGANWFTNAYAYENGTTYAGYTTSSDGGELYQPMTPESLASIEQPISQGFDTEFSHIPPQVVQIQGPSTIPGPTTVE